MASEEDSKQPFSLNVPHLSPDVIPEEPAKEEEINRLVYSSPRGNTRRSAEKEEVKHVNSSPSRNNRRPSQEEEIKKMSRNFSSGL